MLSWCLKFCNPVKVECEYGNVDYWPYDGSHKFYHCIVKNNPKITSRESAQIESVSGTHKNGKTNDDEISFYAYHKTVSYLPSGLDKIYLNLRGVFLVKCKLKEIHQDDLKPYPKLTHFQVTSGEFRVLEKGLFDSNPNIEYIIFENCNIFSIYPTIFDNLKQLATLHLSGNTCINEKIANNATGVMKIIKHVKLNCTSLDYFDEKMNELDEESNMLNVKLFSSIFNNLKSFQNELNSSKYHNSMSIQKRLQNLKIKIEEVSLKSIKEISESINVQISFKDSHDKHEEGNKNFELSPNLMKLILMCLSTFIQTIILVLIYKILVRN